MARLPLVIFGNTAFAEVAHEYFEMDGGYEVAGFCVDAAYRDNDAFQGLPLVSTDEVETRFDPTGHAFFIAATYGELNRFRANKVEAFRRMGYTPASYVSPRAFVAPSATLGEHCFVMEGNVVQTRVMIGDDCILWSGNHIGHHSTLGDHVFVSSHVVVSGFCSVGANSFLGVNATLANNISLGRDCWLGPGTIATRDMSDATMLRGEGTEPFGRSTHRVFRIKDEA